jgi:hypothetical protein
LASRGSGYQPILAIRRMAQTIFGLRVSFEHPENRTPEKVCASPRTAEFLRCESLRYLLPDYLPCSLYFGCVRAITRFSLACASEMLDNCSI